MPSFNIKITKAEAKAICKQVNLPFPVIGWDGSYPLLPTGARIFSRKKFGCFLISYREDLSDILPYCPDATERELIRIR